MDMSINELRDIISRISAQRMTEMIDGTGVAEPEILGADIYTPQRVRLDGYIAGWSTAIVFEPEEDGGLLIKAVAHWSALRYQTTLLAEDVTAERIDAHVARFAGRVAYAVINDPEMQTTS